MRNIGERKTNFRDTCPNDIKYLPQVDGLWDLGGLFACGGECFTWLVRNAKKRGYQTKVDHYTTKKYQEGGEEAWEAAIHNSKQFINMVCDEEEAVERAKVKKRESAKRARLDKNDASASAAASAVVAAPTPPPPPPPVAAPSQPVIQPSQRLVAAYGAPPPAPVPFADLKCYLGLAFVTTKKMRMTVDGLEAGNHYSGGTCNHNAAVNMRCMLNHIDEQLNKIQKELP